MRKEALDPFGAIGGGQFRTHPSQHGAELRLAGWDVLYGGEDIIVAIAKREAARTSSTVSKVDCEREAKPLDDAAMTSLPKTACRESRLVPSRRASSLFVR